MNMSMPLTIHPSIRLVALLLCSLAASASTAHAQISITPTRVIVTAPHRSGEVLAVNPLDRPLVVTTRVMFMVIRNDSTGAMVYDSVPRGDARSCAEWVQVFPRKFTMEPGTKRTVRLLIAPPDSISDGEYMARVEFAGLPVDRPATADADTSTIRPRISVRLALNIPVVYRKGALVTNIDMNVVGVQIDSLLHISLGLRPTGNSIYRGTLFSTIRSSSGTEVATAENQFVSEVPYIYPLSFPKLLPGSYTLDIESQTVRKGTAADAVIPAPATKRTFQLTVVGTTVAVETLH